MSILSALGLGGRKVRYGVVALGDIVQKAFLPGVENTGNSEVTAFATRSHERVQTLGERTEVQA